MNLFKNKKLKIKIKANLFKRQISPVFAFAFLQLFIQAMA